MMNAFAKMQASLSNLKNVEIQFTSLEINAVMMDTLKQKGTMKLGGAGEFWIVLEGQEFISNKKYLWHHIKSQKQVVWQKADSALGFAHPSQFLAKFSEATPLALRDSPQEKWLVLELGPNKALANFSKIEVSLSRSQYQPKVLLLQDAEGNQTIYQLRTIRNKKFKSSAFNYKPPKNTEVLDLREKE